MSIHDDKRYSINLEFCGHAKPHYVARFCGEFIASSLSRPAMVLKCIGHNNVRLGAEIFTEQKAATK
jgi:hypothetical protein